MCGGRWRTVASMVVVAVMVVKVAVVVVVVLLCKRCVFLVGFGWLS